VVSSVLKITLTDLNWQNDSFISVYDQYILE